MTKTVIGDVSFNSKIIENGIGSREYYTPCRCEYERGDAKLMAAQTYRLSISEGTPRLSCKLCGDDVTNGLSEMLDLEGVDVTATMRIEECGYPDEYGAWLDLVVVK